MDNIIISGGSEKQIAWAKRIAAEWLSELDTEIANVTARLPYGDAVEPYLAALRAKREGLVAGLGKATAKQVIDLRVAKRNPVPGLIRAARQGFTPAR